MVVLHDCFYTAIGGNAAKLQDIVNVVEANSVNNICALGHKNCEHHLSRPEPVQLLDFDGSVPRRESKTHLLGFHVSLRFPQGWSKRHIWICQQIVHSVSIVPAVIVRTLTMGSGTFAQ